MYRDAEEFAQEIMELINERNSMARSGGVGAKVCQPFLVCWLSVQQYT